MARERAHDEGPVVCTRTERESSGVTSNIMHAHVYIPHTISGLVDNPFRGPRASCCEEVKQNEVYQQPKGL